MTDVPPLRSVDWPAAIRAAEARDPMTAAWLASLSALFDADFESGLSVIAQASDADPFNPTHQLRLALHYARFGELERAMAALQALQRLELNMPLVPYLRALLALRAGRPEQARALAASLETTHPDFAPGKFLRAEAQIITAARSGNLERFLRPLPQDARWASCWADLLVKLILLHPAEGPSLAERYAKRAGKSTPARSAVDKALAWAAAPVSAFAELIGQEPPGSRAEALLLECLVDKLDQQPSEAAGEPASTTSERAMGLLADLAARFPERGALRQVRHAFTARRGATLAAENRPDAAMRFVERCLTAEPYNLTYHQNRAALFTLMRQAEGYHEAWAALNANQYRLLLLGEADALVLNGVVKTHRLFAQQARGGSDRMERALFRRVEREEGEPWEQVNSDAIGADPDLLRQWFHHQRAQLLFHHLMLGGGERLLLSPQDSDEARARGETLAAMTASLPVLVAEEGTLLAEQLGARWRNAVEGVRTRWLERVAPVEEADDGGAAAAADEPVSELQTEHLSTLADLCLLAMQWQPNYDHLWIAEELLDWALVEVAFADVRRLAELERELGHKTPYALRVLAGRVRGVAEAGGDEPSLSEAAVRPAVEQCLAELLRKMAYVGYEGSGGGKDRADRALAYVERARAYDRTDPDIELAAAEFFSIGEYYVEAREALAQFRRLASPDNDAAITRADKLSDILREHQEKGEKGRRREARAEADLGEAGDAERVAELMRDVDDAPNSWRGYAALVRELALADRFEEAVVWADRCVSHCLGRNEQINARGLAIETRGVQALAATNPRAAKLYAVGGHEPARRAIDALADQGAPLDFSLHYLHGRCLLTVGQPDAAVASFTAALEACETALYRTVLRRLTADIDQAYLDVARRVIDDTLKDEAYEEALAEGVRVLDRLKTPAAWLVDLARVSCQVAVGRLGAGAASALPAIDLKADWRPRLEQALAQPNDADRAVALAELAQALYPPSAAQAQVVLARALWLQRQAAAAGALAGAGKLLAARRFGETLAMLDALPADLAAEPRLKRLRILALLGAHRFRDADAQVRDFGDPGGADLRAFLDEYPALSFRQRIALAQTMLREGRARETLDVLETVVAPGAPEAIELGYCRAFATALEGYELKRDRDLGGARRKFQDALLLLEPHMRGSAVPTYVTEIFDRLDKEVEQYVG